MNTIQTQMLGSLLITGLIAASLQITTFTPVNAFAETAQTEFSPEEQTRMFNAALYHLVKQGNYEDLTALLKQVNRDETPAGLYMTGTAYQNANKGEEALLYLERAAAQNYGLAYAALGEIYAVGVLVPRDFEKAVSLFEQGAAAGSTTCMTYLGDFSFEGLGVPEDKSKAFKWFTQAAEKGDAYAQRRMGDCYLSGLGVEKNLKTALQWYTHAASRGDAYSQYQMGNLLGTTTDAENAPIKPDWVEAYKWYTLAINQQFQSAEAPQKHLEGYLTPEQLQEAKKRIAEWKPAVLPAQEGAQDK